jgi:Flp pilus assembly protein TadD
VGGVALAAWLALVLQAVGLTAAWALQRSQEAVARDDYAAAEDAAQLARRVEPWSAEPYMQLALARVRIRTGDYAIQPAREAVEHEPTNWRTWLVLTRVEARSARINEAARDAGVFGRYARNSPLKPSFQQLVALANSTDTSLSPPDPNAPPPPPAPTP